MAEIYFLIFFHKMRTTGDLQWTYKSSF